jgi:hypothetical protein
MTMIRFAIAFAGHSETEGAKRTALQIASKR